MRKIYFAVTVILFCSRAVEAQTITNSDFENWTSSGKEPPFDWQEPTGWTSSNSMTEWTSAGVRKGSQAYHGSSAVILASVMISDGWYSMICNGTPQKVSDFSAPRLDIITGGEPITIKPSKLTGYYKFNAKTAGDSAYAVIILKKWNSLAGHTDTIGMGAKVLAPAAAYTHFEVPVDYTFSVQPDSVVIAFYSTDPNKPAKPAQFTDEGELTIDYISLDDAAGVRPDEPAAGISIYPNPSAGDITIRSQANEAIEATLFSVDGKAIGYFRGTGKVTIQRSSSIKPGLYFMKVSSGGRPAMYRLILD